MSARVTHSRAARQGALGVVLWVWHGWYEVTATTGHSRPVPALLETTMRRSIAGAAAGVVPPHLRSWPHGPKALAAWIRAPLRLRPGTAMPDPGVSEAHARRMAGYLLDPRH